MPELAIEKQELYRGFARIIADQKINSPLIFADATDRPAFNKFPAALGGCLFFLCDPSCPLW
jgi:hypothetical protein